MISKIIITGSALFSKSDKDDLLKSLNENLSINYEVENETYEIYKKFLEQNNKTLYNERVDACCSKKVVKFVYNVFGKLQMPFIFNCYNIFRNGEDPNYYRKKYFLGHGSTTSKGITINVEIISGTKINTDIRGILQHELEHVFQKIKTEKNILYANKISKDLNKKIYLRAIKVLSPTFPSEYSIEETRIAQLIYSHTDFEEDAFVNALYSNLTDKNQEKSEDEIIKTSAAFRYYKSGKTLLAKIEQQPEKYEKIISQYGFTLQNFLKLYKYYNKRFIMKIGKVLTRYNQYFIENGGLIDSFHERIII